MCYRILAAGIMALGPLIASAAEFGEVDAATDERYNNYVIADALFGFVSPFRTALQIDMHGTTTRRNVVAMPADDQSAGPSTLVATSTASKTVAPAVRRYERRCMRHRRLKVASSSKAMGDSR
jgi:hypothetical protein